jgi:exosortase family protein XrtM
MVSVQEAAGLTMHRRKKMQKAPGSMVKTRRRSWLAGKGPILWFGLKFGVLMALFYALLLTPFFDRLLYVYLGINARLASAILNWLGQASHVSEITIRSAKFAVTVRRGCDAVEPAWFFCAAVLSFPASFVRKIPGMLAGVVLILALNLLRIVSLYFIGLQFPRFFAMAHLEIWPAIFIVMAILLWAGWIGWTESHDPREPHATA